MTKQFISDLARMPDMKQAERDLIAKHLADFDSVIPVDEFAGKVKTELLPLKRIGSDNIRYGGEGGYSRTRWENIHLPEDLRGDVTNYSENIYESPIKTQAGKVHFGSQSDNYFAHTRTEDIPASSIDEGRMGELRRKNMQAPLSDEEVKEFYRLQNEANNTSKTRRVVEIQSDLFQKGRIDAEYSNTTHAYGMMTNEQRSEMNTLMSGYTSYGDVTDPDRKAAIQKILDSATGMGQQRSQELDKLQPYKNTWHQRVIREEIKKAAEDGVSELQFPTGKTAAKIEGYIGSDTHVPQDATIGDTFDYGGETMRIVRDYGNDVDAVPDSAVTNEFNFSEGRSDEINNFLSDIDYNGYEVKATLDDARLGAQIDDAYQRLVKQYEAENDTVIDEDSVNDIVTLLEDQFPAIRSDIAEAVIDDRYPDADAYAEYATENFGTKYIHIGDDRIIQLDEGASDAENFTKGVTDDMPDDEVRDSLSENQQRVYDFYEKDVQKYLKKIVPQMERIVDPQGVEWFQIPIDPAKATQPVNALSRKKEQEQQQPFV